MAQTQQDDLAREHKERGAQLFAKGKLEPALGEYQRAVQASPSDVVARRKVAELLARLGRNADAVHAYQLLVGRFAAEGRLLEAIALSKVILQLEPAHVETQAALARLYAQRSSSSGTPQTFDRELLPASMSGAIDFTHARAARQTPAKHPSSSAGTPAPAASHAPDGAPRVDIDVSELPATPLFSELPEQVMQVLLERLTMLPYVAGDTIIKEGDVGRSLFVIASGSAEVVRKNAAGQSVVIDKMPEGTFFGEIGLVADVPRIASVIAVEDCVVLEVPRQLIAELGKKFPTLPTLVRSFYKTRLLQNLMRQSPLFAPLSQQERVAVVDKFAIRAAKAGEVLLKQGAEGPGIFLILRGRCTVSYLDVGGSQHILPEMGEGTVMGEISLIKGSAVTATVTALVPSVLLFLEPAPFVEYLLGNPGAREQMNQMSDERVARTEALEQEVALQPAFL